MRIVKLTLPLEAYAKSLFKDTIGNDLQKLNTHRIFCINKNVADTFTRNTAIIKNIK